MCKVKDLKNFAFPKIEMEPSAKQTRFHLVIPNFHLQHRWSLIPHLIWSSCQIEDDSTSRRVNKSHICPFRTPLLCARRFPPLFLLAGILGSGSCSNLNWINNLIDRSRRAQHKGTWRCGNGLWSDGSRSVVSVQNTRPIYSQHSNVQFVVLKMHKSKTLSSSYFI